MLNRRRDAKKLKRFQAGDCERAAETDLATEPISQPRWQHLSVMKEPILHRVRKNSLVECVWKPVDQTERNNRLLKVEDTARRRDKEIESQGRRIIYIIGALPQSPRFSAIMPSQA